MAALDRIADALRGGSNSTEFDPDSAWGMCLVMGGYQSFTGVGDAVWLDDSVVRI